MATATTAATALDIHESGDAALRVVVRTGDAEADWVTAHSLAGWLAATGIEGIYGAVPTYDSVLIEFDPFLTSAGQVRSFVSIGMRELEMAGPAVREPRRFEVPVVYGGEYGPDLERVATHQGLTVEDVVARHTAKTYVVRCLGAPAGSPMMDGPDFPYPVPRLKDPRLSVPAGAVSVAGRQAVIAPAVAPGGWCVIGQTPLTVLDAAREPLVPYLPGDELRFYPIREEDFGAFAGQFLEARP
jgi:KipI family sensor histidine kinase inhibitor